ncbi:MAG: type II toxin-antitoxin system HicB family antitoxin [Patescibacteria group bacterium]
MKKKILQYLVIVEPDERTGTDEPCYTVFCPTLGLADSGDTVEEALERMGALIRFHLQCLKKEGLAIPKERTEKSLITTIQVPLPAM